jgi:hypothetical protein
MASASRRYLPLLIGFLVLALWGSGCFERATGKTIASEPPLSKQAIIVLVARNLTLSGTPEPPLSKESTRAERGAYLEATEAALDQLALIGSARSDRPSSTPKLLLDDQSAQTLAISKLLAVELADAIDRADVKRAVETLHIADDFARAISARSVPDWSLSATVADSLANGVKSVSSQFDAEMADHLIAEIHEIGTAKVEPTRVLELDSRRISAWLEAAKATSEPVRPESVMMIVGVNPESRAVASQYAAAVTALAPSGAIAPEVFRAECRLGAEQVATYLGEPRGPLPSVDAERHPVAGLILTVLQPTYSIASQLPEIQAENWRLLALTIHLVASGMPEKLDSAGELAISPVSKLPFEYVRRDKDFDLVRPRPKATP